MIKTTVEARAAMPTKPLAYDEACQRFADWCERESAKDGEILFSGN